jgi:uncharacterized membrane protein YfcA
MDASTVLLAFSAFAIAAFLKGLTGLGFSTLCLGFLALFMDLKLAIPLVFIPSLSSNIMVMVQSGRFFEALRRFWPLYISALPGLTLGIWFLDASQNDAPKAILGISMLLYGIWGLQKGLGYLSGKREKQLMLPVGIVSGMVNGATGSQLMPIMPYLLSLKMDQDIFVQTINCAFTFNTLVMITALGKLGLVTLPVVLISAGGVIPVALGIFLGGRIRKGVSDEFYRKMVLILLIVLGVNLVLRPFL